MSSQLINDRKIRIGLIGYGQIAKKHIKAIRELTDDLSLVAITDANPQALHHAMQTESVDGYSDLNDMLQKSNLDIVTICTPSGLHAMQTMACAGQGKHVICEKPMAVKWQDGLAMVDVCKKNNVNLFVVKQNRNTPTLQLLKQAIDKKRFGKIYQVAMNVFWTRPQDYYDTAPWRGTWEYDGGALMNQASHYVDLFHWLFGAVESVSAFTATQARNIETEDSAVMNVRWRNGALGSLNVSMLTYPKNLEASLTVLGEKGTVKIGGVSVNNIEHWEFADVQPEDNHIVKASEETTQAVGFGHTYYYQNVIDTLRGKTRAATDGSSGLHSLELLIAAYRSARDGITIHLPLEI
ncbi:MAG: Gfo/Idh/MocA family oxidoreductase [Legionellales bacterium]|nr:Gfo/Idh/MocA family oxidoreductase [Legionellales bacterium]